MISRLGGSIIRAFFVILFVATPSLMLPGTSPDAAQIVALVALCAAVLTIFEYSCTYPGLVEFRDAPPFNRIRFFSLFLTVFLLTVICRGAVEPSTPALLVQAIGAVIGQAIDFPYSPIRLVVLMLPAEASVAEIALVRACAGLAFLIALLTLAVFLILQRITGWPLRTGSFNVWINLPTFDPTAGGDVVERLERDARINIALGFVLPFVTPTVIKAASSVFGTVTLDNPHALIWTVAAWAFLPASLFMRGIAMGRIAGMIKEKRRQTTAAEQGDLLPV